MYATQPKKRDSMTIKTSILDVATGHRNWFGGAGKHKDKRYKRQRTRSARLRVVLAN
jgi:hypothetical protein